MREDYGNYAGMRRYSPFGPTTREERAIGIRQRVIAQVIGWLLFSAFLIYVGWVAFHG